MWTADRLSTCLQKFHTSDYAWNNLASPLSDNRKAAVLIPLVIKNGALHIWLTLRSSKLKNDGGDVAFPGGMQDPSDSDEEHTCLREAEEEIGLKPQQVQILAHLLPSINRRQILVTPIVGLVDEKFVPTPNPDEVEAAFILPLERFLSSEDYTSYKYNNRGLQWTVHNFQDTVGEQLFRTWGLTASICVNLAIALFQREPDFEWDNIGTNTMENPYAMQYVYLKRYSEEKIKEIQRHQSRL